MKTKIIKLSFVLIVMITIFLFSNQEATESQALSANVVYKTKEIITNKKDDCKNNKCIDSNYNKIIRKIAHFTLYFVLGISVYLFIKEFYSDKRLIIYTILICLLYATSDEIHQLFVPGRSFQLLDILIDTLGSIVSLIIIKIINKVRTR